MGWALGTNGMIICTGKYVKPLNIAASDLNINTKGGDAIPGLMMDTDMSENISNYPNPFNGNTTIEYTLATDGNVSLSIYDLNGRRIAKVIDGHQPEGHHTVVFNASGFPTGHYVGVLHTSTETRKLKMVISR